MATKLENNPLWLAGYAWAAHRLEEHTPESVRVATLTADKMDEFVLGVLRALADHAEVERLNAEAEK